MLRRPTLFALVAAALGLGAGLAVALRGEGSDDALETALAACQTSTVAGGRAAIGGPFSLVDETGRTVTETEAITRPTLVYFGYASCPDVCPTDLWRNALAADALADRGFDVGQVFITVDPARDTPARIGEYAKAIHPDLLGLSGTPEQLDAAAKAYKVYYRRGEGDDDSYLMDHSTFTYLMAPKVGLLAFFRSDASPQAVADAAACNMTALKNAS